MSKQTLKFNDVIVNRKEFHAFCFEFSRHRQNSCI